MIQEHEYALLGGLNRAKVGRYLGAAASLVSSAIVFVVLLLWDLGKSLGLGPNVPPIVMSLVGAGTVYLVLYWLFDRHVWKLPWISGALRVPNLNGDWRCDGQTTEPDRSPGKKWKGQVTIVQSWDKIRVRLKTAESASNSIAAALVYDEADGFLLMYNYRNEPKINRTDQNAHRGFAELTFTKDLQTAEGGYFNGHGRWTFGTMRLTREDA